MCPEFTDADGAGLPAGLDNATATLPVATLLARVGRGDVRRERGPGGGGRGAGDGERLIETLRALRSVLTGAPSPIFPTAFPENSFDLKHPD